MRYIKKGKEPASLTIYKKQSNAYFDGCNKADIRKQLLLDQGFLCAYCMRRISEDDMKIEHWLPQSKCVNGKDLDFSFMLGVCNGNAGHPKKYTTCDTHRNNDALTVNPLDFDLVNQIKYSTADGRIFSDNEKINYDLDVTLNLNCDEPNAYLCTNRKSVLEEFLDSLKRQMACGPWTKALLQKYLRIYEKKDAQGKFKPYSEIVIWYLRKRLKRLI